MSMPVTIPGRLDEMGPLQRRASRTISNAALYDLVQDMARVVDTIPARLDHQDAQLARIMEALDARNQDT